MAFEPDFETVAGSRLLIAAGKPTDDTEAAYETLFTAATGGDEFELTNLGQIEGRSSNTATLTVLSRGRNREKPGTYTYPQAEFGIQWLPESDAHETAETALRTKAICSFKVVRQSGVTLYFIGYVLNLADSGGGPDDALTGTLTILRDSETIRAVSP